MTRSRRALRITLWTAAVLLALAAAAVIGLRVAGRVALGRALAMDLTVSEQRVDPGREAPTASRGVPFLGRTFLDLSRAELLRRRLQLADLFAAPYGTAPERFERSASPMPWRVYRIIAWVATSDTGHTLAHFQFAAAERQLVDAALALRRLDLAGGAFPDRPPAIPELERPDSFTGSQLGYRVLPDRSAEIAVVNAGELLHAIRVPTRAANFLAQPAVLEP